MIRVYLDFNATTPVEPEVLDAMLPYFSAEFANAASIHTPGQRARAAVETAREQVAALIGARPQEIVFTSGGTEADNHAIFGVAQAPIGASGAAGTASVHKHIITTSIEHEAVLNTVMQANNELGTVQPLAEIGRIAAESDVYFHTDAVQSAGKLPIDVNALRLDLLALSARTFYGRKGVGALYIPGGTRLQQLLS